MLQRQHLVVLQEAARLNRRKRLLDMHLHSGLNMVRTITRQSKPMRLNPNTREAHNHLCVISKSNGAAGLHTIESCIKAIGPVVRTAHQS